MMNTFPVINSLILLVILAETSLVSSKLVQPVIPQTNFVQDLTRTKQPVNQTFHIVRHNSDKIRSGSRRSYHFADETFAPGGYIYKLNNEHEFNIRQDILGYSLHIDSSDEVPNVGRSASQNVGSTTNQNVGSTIKENSCADSTGIVFVPSPYYEDFDEDFDIIDEDEEEEDEEEDDYDEMKLKSSLMGEDGIAEDNFNERRYRKWTEVDSTNSSNAEKFSTNYFQAYVRDHPNLLEKLTKGNYRDKPLNPPLFLTPYAYSGNYLQGQKLAAVKPFVGDVKSYSGYLTVDSRFHSNLFFWFFPSESTDYRDRPVLLWLQGGPGASSLFGLFYENGPYKIVDGKILRNEETWTKQYNVLYIDNPVGTGFSFTTPQGLARNQTIIGQHLYEALKQFFHLFPELADNDFYITGESYAGKYIPAAAYEIHTRNLLSHLKINLKGLFIGNGLIDPVSMLEYHQYLYHVGLLDEYQRDLFARVENRIKLFIRTKQWRRANIRFENLFFSSRENKTKGPNFRRLTGFRQHYNLNGLDFSTRDFNHFIQDVRVREHLHVGYMKFNTGQEVGEALLGDIMKSVLPKVNILVENYRVVFYYGQLDIICPYRLSEAFFHKIQFRHAYDYYKAERKIWTYERQDYKDNVVGYIKEAHNLVEVLIRNAGHMVPRDQPRFTKDLLRMYIGS